jgi:hypothetical protein
MGDCNGGKAAKSLPVASAGSHPLTPFVVGNQGGGDENYGENAEKNLHWHIQDRIGWGLEIVLSMAFS